MRSKDKLLPKLLKLRWSRLPPKLLRYKRSRLLPKPLKFKWSRLLKLLMCKRSRLLPKPPRFRRSGLLLLNSQKLQGPEKARLLLPPVGLLPEPVLRLPGRGERCRPLVISGEMF